MAVQSYSHLHPSTRSHCLLDSWFPFSCPGSTHCCAQSHCCFELSHLLLSVRAASTVCDRGGLWVLCFCSSRSNICSFSAAVRVALQRTTFSAEICLHRTHICASRERERLLDSEWGSCVFFLLLLMSVIKCTRLIALNKDHWMKKRDEMGS